MDRNAHHLGFTKFVIDSLKAPQGVKVPGAVLMFGGLSDEEVASTSEHCYTEMEKWVVLMLHTFDAEMPKWHILRQLNLFDASEQNFSSRMSDRARRAMQEEISRVAHFMKFSEEQFANELHHYMPLAKAVRERKRATSDFEAWSLALDQRKDYVERHPAGLLTQALEFMGVLEGCTTSGIEHGHSKHALILTSFRGSSSTTLENDEMFLCQDWQAENEDAIVKEAMELWRRYYGHIRERKVRRIDAGVPRSGAPDTYAAWRRRRRADVTAAASGREHVDVSALKQSLQESMPGLEDPCLREIDFAASKQRAEFLKGIAENTVLPHERTDADVQAAAALQQKKETARHERKQAAAKRAEKLQSKIIDMHGKLCYFDETVRGDGKPPAWCLRAVGLSETDTLERCQLVVTRWPGKHSLLVKWHAILTGAPIVSPLYLASGGKQGSCLSFQAAVRSKRFVWISNDWESTRPNLMKVINSALQTEGSKWERLESRQDFLTSTHFFVNRPTPQIRKFSAVALVTAEEKALQDTE